MLRTLALVLAIALAGWVGWAATRPDTFRVERRIVIRAPAARVHALVDDFHRWRDWSPWERLDPALERRYEGAESGRGAAYAWQGNAQVGQGRMEIVDSQPPAKVTIRLDFVKPFEAHNTAEFELAPHGDAATEVRWSMYGPSPLLARMIGVVYSMDRAIGRDFEAGLANLKAVAER